MWKEKTSVLGQDKIEDFDNQDEKCLNNLNMLATGAASEENITLRTSPCVLEQATVPSCFPDCPCCSFVVPFAALGQERNTKKALYPQQHKKGPALKAA